MSQFIVFLTFIPWYLYFTSLCKDALKKLEHHKFGKSWIKKNFFTIFHLPNIILFLIFVFFSTTYSDANQIWITTVLLFTCINLYLFINHFYDKNKAIDKVDSINMSVILITVILVTLPIMYYFSSKNYVVTYYILFAYSFFNYFIVYLAKLIEDILLKRVFKNDKK